MGLFPVHELDRYFQSRNQKNPARSGAYARERPVRLPDHRSASRITLRRIAVTPHALPQIQPLNLHG